MQTVHLQIQKSAERKSADLNWDPIELHKAPESFKRIVLKKQISLFKSSCLTLLTLFFDA